MTKIFQFSILFEISAIIKKVRNIEEKVEF